MEEPFFSPHRMVRDLAWVVGSNPLLDIPENLFSPDKTAAEYALQKNFLLQLSANPAPLQAHLEGIMRQTLGSYFEALVAFWLMHRRDTALLGKNLQVQEGGTTLGEMDFIVKIEQHVVHLETAVKLYLNHGNQPEWRYFIGPAAHDRLDIKMETLLSRQLPLSEHPAGKQLLAERGIEPDYSRLFLKGYFFFPYSAGSSYWWCRQSEARVVFMQQNPRLRYEILPRLHWLSPSYYEDNTALYDATALIKQLPASREQSLLVAMLAEGEMGWYECGRGFIVPDCWPQHQ